METKKATISKINVVVDMKKKNLNEMSNEELWQLFPIILSPHNPECPDVTKQKKSCS
ncbi:hypothetical protein [Parabacteroides sp. AM58-2XD]|uniref:hypothetical protein n=1 Tax=Parabacteroides sp. AM58-2XD TaxID=2292362 RepID=UPI001F3585EC|nr:hypothetical protein [Parabacteroides sp. AM58-2XD]